MGTENIGKSTLLNCLFDTDFTTNENNQTIQRSEGVDYQYVKHNDTGFHIFDSEGIFC